MSVNQPDEQWKTRRKSWLVKCLMKKYNFSPEFIANILGCPVSYANNKLSRCSYSFEDILMIVDGTGHYLAIHDKNDPSDIMPIDASSWFEDTDTPTFNRLMGISEDQKTIKEAHQLYFQKKAELEELKFKYGFKD